MKYILFDSAEFPLEKYDYAIHIIDFPFYKQIYDEVTNWMNVSAIGKVVWCGMSLNFEREEDVIMFCLVWH